MRAVVFAIVSLVGLLGGAFFYTHSRKAPRAEQATSYRVGYENLGLLGLSSSRLVVTSTPTGAKVSLDGGKQTGTTPLVIESPDLGSHKLAITAENYEPLEVSIEIANGFMTRVEADLVFNPLNAFDEVDVNQLEGIGLTADQVEIKPRASWALGPAKLAKEAIQTSPWEKIHVFGVDVPPDVAKGVDFLQNMDTLAQEQAGLPSLPFAYLVDEQGQVYEGLGIYDFNYASLNLAGRFSFSAGEAPVLILNFSGEMLNPSVEQSLLWLRKELGKPPQFRAKLLTVLDQITLQTQEQRELSLEFVNTGNAVWYPDKAKLVVEPIDRTSEFYTPQVWLSTTEVSQPDQPIVLPGAIGKFKFTLTAPAYPDDFTERLRLFGEVVELKIKVEGEAGRIVQVSSTPTGYLNVREGPGIGYALKGVVYPGEKYLVLEEARNWYKLRLRDGSEGWVIGSYVQEYK